MGRELEGEGRHATRERIEERARRVEKSMAGGTRREGASAGRRAPGRHLWREIRFGRAEQRKKRARRRGSPMPGRRERRRTGTQQAAAAAGEGDRGAGQAWEVAALKPSAWKKREPGERGAGRRRARAQGKNGAL
jgi:hypothetical protein